MYYSLYTLFQNGHHFSILLFSCKLTHVALFLNSKCKRILSHWLLELFAKKAFFWTFWWSLGWASAKLPLTWLKMRLQHSCLPFSPPASHFSAMWLGHVQKSKFLEENVTYILKLFDFWNFFCAFPFSPFLFFFAAVIDLLLGLLAVKKLLRKHHRDGQFLAWSSQV